MADEEHLRILKQGVEVWNRWRQKNPDVRPDLSEATLHEADLVGVDLSGANLRDAMLSKADLRWANLSDADLSGVGLGGANLRGANLRGARLKQAYLIVANLSAADLGGAHLSAADLSGADLSGANLRGADLYGANLTRVDLRETQIDDSTRIDDNWRLACEILSQGAVGRDLRGADLHNARLYGALLRGADLTQANLRGADLRRADLRGADLRETDLNGTLIDDSTQMYYRWRLVWEIVNEGAVGRNLRKANLSGANLRRVDLSGADLSEADLSGAKLERATLVDTNLKEANLTGCSIYGISAWDLNLEGATQIDLIISPSDEPVITVDNLEVAQFIYLLLHNEKIRSVIDTITSKVVLILGRFTPERKVVLDAMRDELRQRPALFDFEKPSSRDLTETISTLAHMARFVIADITDARSIPQELQRIVPDLPSVPVQPLIASSDYEYGMFEHIRRYPWVLDTYQYDSLDELLDALKERVIDPADDKAKELTGR